MRNTYDNARFNSSNLSRTFQINSQDFIISYFKLIKILKYFSFHGLIATTPTKWPPPMGAWADVDDMINFHIGLQWHIIGVCECLIVWS